MFNKKLKQELAGFKSQYALDKEGRLKRFTNIEKKLDLILNHLGLEVDITPLEVKGNEMVLVKKGKAKNKGFTGHKFFEIKLD